MMRFIALATLFGSTLAQQMQLANNYSGSAFFDLWNYKVGNDVTDFFGNAGNEGVVNYTDQAFAQQQNLLFVNSVGNVIVKTDNFTSGVGNASFVRNSLQLLSKEQITPGTLVIMDAIHMPFGCAVWPAFWFTGGANWPSLGEIDIVENVNLATNNAYSLHTTDGCMASSQVAITGDLVSTDCFNATAFDEGCKVTDSTLSYGSGFANNGGGAFAMLWNDAGIQIWFFPRSSIPADLPTPNPNPSGWGTPTAFYPESTCDTTKFFGPQTMILDINVCGNFAVDVWTTCAAVAPQCTDVVPIASTFDDAYFEIRYITVFSNSTTGSSTPSTTATPVTTSIESVISGSTTFVVVTQTPSTTPSGTSSSMGYSLHAISLSVLAGLFGLVLTLNTM
ncbi:glycoside hydrolase family 16 protein [Hypholoma sublateritium FD-334 SS-4]|uniref:Glycoside hydrolase family 16 protein n=1 Tax=Hypholoma sublateritium (strain FD-334 SS-4) TaxID=945553 RepID=A0A0D2L654_HYPSF|nr:glycoside hydrolase family 16 protein [Hypholoma sublateritium FD-334 SS-4]